MERVGLRPLNNVVDCTNYVMWELGQPLHAFDHRFLKGPEIVVRKQKGPCPFTTLDGMERACEPDDLFICDAEGPVALAGIMGGKNSEVREETTDIVLEAAYFDPKRIHRTSKRLKLHSESSIRFERGIDPNAVAGALHRLTELIVKTAGGKPTLDWVDLYSKKIKPAIHSLPQVEMERILGMNVPVGEVAKIFVNLGFQAKARSGFLNVEVPTFRPDISRAIDLVEEVARLRGYDTIPTTLPKIQMNLPKRPARVCAEGQTIDCLTALGYSETCHLSFTDLKRASLFVSDPSQIVAISNPLSEDHAVLRPSLMPNLLKALAYNLHRQRSDIKLFELKKVFEASPDKKVIEKIHLGVVGVGNEWSPQWELKSKPIDFYSLKGVLFRLAKAMHLEGFEFRADEVPSFLAPHAAAGVFFQGKKIGWLGHLHPEILKNWEIEGEVYGLEIEWEVLVREVGKLSLRFKALSHFPFVERDVALVVDKGLAVKEVEVAIGKMKSPWVQKIRLFDLFKGASLPPDKKSLAFNIRYASPERTLTNEEVNQAHSDLISRLERELPAQLRK